MAKTRNSSLSVLAKTPYTSLMAVICRNLDAFRLAWWSKECQECWNFAINTCICGYVLPWLYLIWEELKILLEKIPAQSEIAKQVPRFEILLLNQTKVGILCNGSQPGKCAKVDITRKLRQESEKARLKVLCEHGFSVIGRKEKRQVWKYYVNMAFL